MSEKARKFSRLDRILKAHDFDKIKQRGLKAGTKALFVSVLDGRRRRLGVIASRKVGGAVQRNRLKRVVRDFFRTKRQLFPVGDCVVVFRPGAEDFSNSEIRENVMRALKRF